MTDLETYYCTVDVQCLACRTIDTLEYSYNDMLCVWLE